MYERLSDVFPEENKKMKLKKIRFDISYESTTRHTIHMQCQALSSLKKEKKCFKMLSAAVVIGR